ncbi:MAG: insulinase family protein [Alphaproteobacteria bacterium]|nr:insulinase family protein [Alphaproteobacteria bacterium]
MFVRRGLRVCALIWASMPSAASADVAYERATLANGMEVVLFPNHKVPAVSHSVWYKAGAADELPGASGVAHFLEHLSIRGSKGHPSADFTRIVAENGGDQNGFTNYDYTTYVQTIAVDRLPLMMELGADRMLNLTLEPADIDEERQIIIEERRMRTDNKPERLMAEQMRALLFLHHPYGTPSIGWKNEMEALSRDDAIAFYKAHYNPANAALIVTGDITMEQLMPLAEKYYGALPAGTPVARNWVEEPEGIAPRRFTLSQKEVAQPIWTRLYSAPSLGTDRSLPPEQSRRSYALLLLSHLLGGGQTSRLYQSLVVEQKLATAAGCNYDDVSRGPSQFSLYAIPASGVSMERIEQAVEAEVAKLVATPPAEAELAQAKQLLIAGAIYAQEGLEQIGYIAGTLITADIPLDYLNHWQKDIGSVTAEQVQEAATTVLVANHSVTGILLPEKADAVAVEKQK